MSHRSARIVVATVFASAFAALCAYVASFATPLGFLDDLTQLPWLDPNVRIDAAILWEQHNEHRAPLGRFVYLHLVRAFHDFRAPTWFDVLLLGGAAALLVATAARVRGRLAASDVFFPLLWFSFGPAENLLNGFQTLFVLLAVALVALLAFVARARELEAPAPIALAGLVCATLPLHGIPGVVACAPVALWLAWIAWRALRANEPRRRVAGLIALLAVAVTALVVALYFTGLHLLPTTRRPTLEEFTRTTLQVFGQAGGFANEEQWKWTGPVALVAGVAAACVLARRVWSARDAAKGARDDAPRAAGELALLAAGAAIAFGIGWGRGCDSVIAGALSRYGTFAMLVPTSAYLVFARTGGSRTAVGAQAALALLAAAVWVANVAPGLAYGRERAQAARSVIDQARAGRPIGEIARDHWSAVYHTEEMYREALLRLRALRLAPYDGANADPRLASIADTQITLPDEFDSTAAPHVRIVDGTIVLAVRAPAEMRYRLLEDWHRVRGIVGVPRQPAKSRSAVRLRVLVRGERGDEVVLERIVEPPRSAAEPALHAFEVGFERGASRELVLRIEALEPGGAAWGALARVEVVRE